MPGSGGSPPHSWSPSRLPIPENNPLRLWSSFFGSEGPPLSSRDRGRRASHLLDNRASSFHSDSKTNIEKKKKNHTHTTQNGKKIHPKNSGCVCPAERFCRRQDAGGVRTDPNPAASPAASLAPLAGLLDFGRGAREEMDAQGFASVRLGVRPGKAGW